MEASVYRENSLRAVHVLTPIHADLLARLTPEITALRVAGGVPVTVYIDSPGGSTFITDALVTLLRAPNHEGLRSPLTTVVTHRAASAAADLLISGDYAIAFPDALIHYHGTRSSAEGLTVEDAHQIAGDLQSANERFALRLARRIISRLLFLLTVHRSEIDTNPQGTDLASPVAVFVALLARKLGEINPTYSQLVQETRALQTETSALVQTIIARVSNEQIHSPDEPPAEAQVRLVKALLDYELARPNRPSHWTLLQGGFDELRQHFLQLADFVAGEHNHHRGRLVRDYGTFMLSKEELSDYSIRSAEADDSVKWLDEKAGLRMAEFWYFVLCLCRRLQRGENPFNATAAYWLGMVDEVLGSGLPCMRQIFESRQTADVVPASPSV